MENQSPSFCGLLRQCFSQTGGLCSGLCKTVVFVERVGARCSQEYRSNDDGSLQSGVCEGLCVGGWERTQSWVRKRMFCILKVCVPGVDHEVLEAVSCCDAMTWLPRRCRAALLAWGVGARPPNDETC